MQCARQPCHITEDIREYDPVSNRAVASHGKPGNKRILSFVRKRKHPSCKLRKFFTDKGLIIIPGSSGLKIKGIISRWHDNRKILFFRPFLYTCLADPICIISQQAMQKIQCLVLLIFVIQIAVFISIKSVCGQDHIHRNDPKQCL